MEHQTRLRILAGLMVGAASARRGGHSPRQLRAIAEDLERRFPNDAYVLGLARAYRIRATEIEAESGGDE